MDPSSIILPPAMAKLLFGRPVWGPAVALGPFTPPLADEAAPGN